MTVDYKKEAEMNASGFVPLSDYVPGIVLWGIEDLDQRMKPFFYPDLEKQDLMVKGGFVPYDCEWWHFTLADEPYPETYFEFPIARDSLKR